MIDAGLSRIKIKIRETTTSQLDLTGRVLDGRHELLDKLGAGEHATVYRAQDRALRRQVAVKVLRSGHTRDPEAVQRFRRGAAAAASLSVHPNIVTVYDADDSDGLQYVVMELVSGKTLQQVILSEGPLPIGRCFYITREVATALEFAHRHGLIHGGLDPRDILVGEDGTVKVSDFGWAWKSNGTSGGSSAHYLSPEQMRGQKPEASSDIYSLGVVLLEMVTGRPQSETISPGGAPKLPDPDRTALAHGEVPTWLDAIVRKAMAWHPRDRYASAAELSEALNHREPVASAPLPPPAVRRSGWRLEWLALILVLVVASSIGGAWVAYKGTTNLFGTSSSPEQPAPARHAKGSQTILHHRQSPHPTATAIHHRQPLKHVSGAPLGNVVHFTYVWITAVALQPGQTVSLTYKVQNASARPIPAVLGATLRVDSNGAILTDPAHSVPSTLEPGVHEYQRYFTVPHSATVQHYDLDVQVESPRGVRVYGSIHLPKFVTVGSCCSSGQAGAIRPGR